MLKKSDAKPPAGIIAVPSLEETSAVYAKMRGQRTALANELAALQAEFENYQALCRAGSLNPQATIDHDAPARVAAILGDEGPVARPAGGVDLKRMAEVRQRISDIGSALEELKTRMAAERCSASRFITHNLVDPHRDLVRTLCKQMIALHQTWAEYQEFGDTLNNGDIGWGELRPSFPVFLGSRPSDVQCGMARYLRTAADEGFIHFAEIPASLHDPVSRRRAEIERGEAPEPVSLTAAPNTKRGIFGLRK
jgi:hypothetical protein